MYKYKECCKLKYGGNNSREVKMLQDSRFEPFLNGTYNGKKELNGLKCVRAKITRTKERRV